MCLLDHGLDARKLSSLFRPGTCKSQTNLLSKFPYSNEPVHEISNNVICATSKASDQPAHMQQHLEFLSIKGGCRVSSESTHVKMPHCWKSHALAPI